MTITVENQRSYVPLSSISVEFYNGSSLIPLALPLILPGIYQATYDFSSFLPNATMLFTYKALTSSGIAFEMTVGPLLLNNTPVPNIIENFSVPGFPNVISGDVTIWANSPVNFTGATFYVLLSNGSTVPLAITTNVTTVSSSEHVVNITFNTYTFTTLNGLPFDIGGITIGVIMVNARGESSQSLTSLTYDLHNAPLIHVDVLDPESGTYMSVVQGEVLIVATNTRPYINETSATINFWNGIAFEIVMMQYNSTSRYFSLAWDSRFVSDNTSYALPLTMQTDIGTEATLVTFVHVQNNVDFAVFLPAGVLVHFDLMSHPVLKMMGDVVATQDAYLKIFNTTQPSFSTFGNYYIFDGNRAFNITILSRSGTSVPFQLNVTMVYDYRAFSNFPGLKLNETSI
nr:hypothetical protein [Candidatus Sigynarchaeota archaeon]